MHGLAVLCSFGQGIFLSCQYFSSLMRTADTVYLTRHCKMIVEKDSKVSHFFAGYDWMLIDVDAGDRNCFGETRMEVTYVRFGRITAQLVSFKESLNATEAKFQFRYSWVSVIGSYCEIELRVIRIHHTVKTMFFHNILQGRKVQNKEQRPKDWPLGDTRDDRWRFRLGWIK